MITDARYGVEPWCLTETSLDLDLLAQSESVFSLSNGHIGLRGNLDEGEPSGLPGTYLNSFYEVRPLPYAEAGYGFPDTGQTVINVTNGKVIRLLVNDEPFDIRYGTVRSHTRTLDLRAGTLTRLVVWTSPAGYTVSVQSVRLVSLTQRAIAAISYTVTPVDEPLRLVVMSEIVANEEVPGIAGDPRAAAALAAPLVSEEHMAVDGKNPRAVLVHSTRSSKLRMAAGMYHTISGPERMSVASESYPDLGRLMLAAEVGAGESLHLEKFLGYGWSSQRSRPALVDQVSGALAAAQLGGWQGLLNEQRKYLDSFWEGADVEVDGDVEIQQAVRFGLFHIMQAGARAEYRPIPAKGLTGTGYDGHTFWDTETFVLPVLTYTLPSAAADALRWRYLVMDTAQAHARELGLDGAAFPWRTIRGQETSGYWPAGTAAFHINADIAAAVTSYVDATEDSAFEQEVGLPLLVETARLWRSLGQHDASGQVPDRGRDRAGRVQRDQGQQPVHEPDGAAQSRGCRRPGGKAPRRRARTRRDDRGSGGLAGRRRGHVHPLRFPSRGPPAARRVHPVRAMGLRRHAGRPLSRCSCTTRTSSSTASRSSSRRTWCWRCSCAATRSRPRRSSGTSTTTRR